MTNTSTIQKNGSQKAPAQAEVPSTVWYTPRVDILENNEELTLFADLPGVKPEDANIQYENGDLTLHARCACRQQGVNFVSKEYGVGDFYRVFTLGDTIDPEKIGAELKNGVLTVHLPKAEAVKPKRIAVKGE